MRDLLRRIERLENDTPADGASVFLIGWQTGERRTAKHGGAVIERDRGESEEAFKARAAERFKPAHGVVCVWVG